MYRVTNESGAVIPGGYGAIFVRRGRNGTYQPCARQDAEAVSIPGVGLFPFVGGPPMIPATIRYEDENGELVSETLPVPGAVSVETVPDGQAIEDAVLESKRNANQLADLEAGIIDVADTVNTSSIDTEAALMEIGDTLAALMEQKGE